MMEEELTRQNREALAAAHKYMGDPAWLTVVFTVFICAGFIVNLWLFSIGITPAWLALLSLAILTYMAYTPLHEAVHGNIHGNVETLKWLNDLCGYLVAPLIAVPYASHRVEHMTHHRYTNQPEKDPDFIVSRIGNGPWSAFLTVLRFVWVQNTFFVTRHWKTTTFGKRLTYLAELTLSIGWRVIFLSMIDNPSAVAVVLVGYVAGGAFTAYWFAYRPHIPYRETQRYRNTCSLIMPTWMKPLEWFWLGQNLHSIHHLFPRVPFYRYHALHQDIEYVLRAHGTPILGAFSRQEVQSCKSP